MSSIYLDHAAATPMNERVLAAMQPYFTEKFFNPSATYWPAMEVHKDLEAARATVAGLLGARPVEITFTAGGTEANNLAIHGVMRAHPGANIVVSNIEHDAVLAPAHEYSCREAGVRADGVLKVDKLLAAIDDQTVLVSVMYANNEIGTIEPIRDIAQALDAIRAARKRAGNNLPLLLHTDACQAAAYLDLHVSRLGVDLMTLNGGKMYGPKQSGVLFIKAGLELKPLITGGGQERNVRSGTENVAFAVGFAKALELAQTDRNQEVARLQKLQHFFIFELTAKIPDAVVNGSLKKRLPNNVHVTFPGQDNERLLFALDEAGILAAAGSACSASSDEPSHVLKAIGLSDAEARASLRFSFGHQTDEAALTHTLETLVNLVA